MVDMVKSPPTSSGGLESLPARPPTPPRETQQRLSHQSQPLHPLLNLQTPPGHSTLSPSDSSFSISQRQRKKVDFTAQANYQEAPAYSNKKNAEGARQQARASAPSLVTSARPLKSILKPSPAGKHLDPVACDSADGARASLTTMLESTIRQLAGADRDCKIDAYMILVRALKVSNNLPDRIALQDKMGLFAQFIQRDITTKGSGDGLDSSLINHALTLLVTFQHFPAIASTLTSDFGVFITDHCIRSFEDPSIPKDVARHLMQVIASQDFSPKVMTAERIGRLVASLHNIENHLKGKSIIMSRIIIYRKLIKQSRQHMLLHSDWLLDLFTDMLSTLKEIRSAAIALGFDTCLNLGKEKQLSKRVLEILQVAVDNTKYIEYYIEKLKSMTKEKTESAVVPQIWSVIVLLLRFPIDRWEYFVPWLDIIQKCFNSSDWQTKHEANFAWNRLVYVLQQNETSFYKTLGTMCQPFVSQLRRKVTGAKQEDLRQTVLGSIGNLYYYAFKPNTNLAHLDTLWRTCVVPVMSQLAMPEGEPKGKDDSAFSRSNGLTSAATLLTGLLDSSTPRIWKDDRVFDKAPIKFDELPALDSKWVRRNAPKIFLVISPILEVNFLELSDASSSASQLWHTVINAVVAASSKEVKVSIDTATFIGSALGFLLRIWSSGLDDTDVAQGRRFLSAVQQYLAVMLGSLGLLPFTEKQLSINKQNTFVPAATPSHREVKSHNGTKSPLYHLFWILSTQSPNIPDDEHSLIMVRSVLSPFFATRTALARRDLAYSLMHSLGQESSCSSANWQFIAEILETALSDSQGSHSSVSSSAASALGHEYRGIVKHLERGLMTTPNLRWDSWHSLFTSITDRAIAETGVAGSAMAIIEPLAKVTLECLPTGIEALSDSMRNVGCVLISCATQPRDRQALETSRRRLWGTLAAGTRSASFDPFDNLYRLINSLLIRSYNKLSAGGTEEPTNRMLGEVAAFLARSNAQLALATLQNLQPGISRWVQDADNRYDSRQLSPVSTAVQILWTRARNIIGGGEGLGHVELDSVELLLCAALQSKHAKLVESAIALWNEAFEHAETVVYPEQLKTVLLAISGNASIVLPGLQIPSQEESLREVTFPESQHVELDENLPSDEHARLPKPTPKGVSQPRKVFSPQISSPAGSVRLSFPAVKSIALTPRRALRKRERKRTGPARLRHDDSQIQFSAIESSSPSHEADTQRLTERQVEIRERQRGASALYSDLRSDADQDIAMKEIEPELPQQAVQRGPATVLTTPERSQAFDHFVSSTPTPRRGQSALVMDEQDGMDDVPSSPPEPRRNLLPKMRTRSRSNSSIMDDFQFSSSPVAGSPTTERQIFDRVDVVASGYTITSSEEGHNPLHAEALSTSPQATELSPAKPSQRPSTPPQRRRTRSAHDSPRSDVGNEEYVDALTSPQHRSPREMHTNGHLEVSHDARIPRGAIVSRSFDLSEGEEHSMARLVVELDSRRCDPVPPQDSPSPNKTAKTMHGLMPECITVEGETNSQAGTPRRSPRHSQIPSPINPSTPQVAESPPGLRRSERKRKRTNEVADSTQKKPKHRIVEPDAMSFAISESQSSSDDDLSSSAAEDEKTGREPSQELGEPTSSSPLSFHDDSTTEVYTMLDHADANSSDISETEAVNSQVLAEASQDGYSSFSVRGALADGTNRVKEETALTYSAADLGEEAADVMMEDMAVISQDTKAPGVESVSASIMTSLRAGLCALQTAQLSRHEVYEIEDMFMDIKKALYAAEGRSRSGR